MAYQGYTGQCIGRLMTFLYRYTWHADRFVFGDGNVYSNHSEEELVGTYTWDKDEDGNETDVPTFQFTKEFRHLSTEQTFQKDQILHFNPANIICPICSDKTHVLDESGNCEYCERQREFDRNLRQGLGLE
jgi:hypothetical protein